MMLSFLPNRTDYIILVGGSRSRSGTTGTVEYRIISTTEIRMDSSLV